MLILTLDKNFNLYWPYYPNVIQGVPPEITFISIWKIVDGNILEIERYTKVNGDSSACYIAKAVALSVLMEIGIY